MAGMNAADVLRPDGYMLLCAHRERPGLPAG